MIVGVPREIKPGEERVALTPAGARGAERGRARRGRRARLGLGSGIGDEEYAAAGAALDTVKRVWASADLILKVKEPMAAEIRVFPRADRSLFTYLHPRPSAR